jgi:predicted small secreted protein
MKKFYLLILAALFLMISTIGCQHTAKGVEKDLKNAGRHIEHAVE